LPEVGECMRKHYFGFTSIGDSTKSMIPRTLI